MFRATVNEHIQVKWYKSKKNEISEYEEPKMFLCKILERGSKELTRPMRNVISNDTKLILYATNCSHEMNPNDKVEVKGIGTFKVEAFHLDFESSNVRNFGMHPAILKQRCPKYIFLK